MSSEEGHSSGSEWIANSEDEEEGSEELNYDTDISEEPVEPVVTPEGFKWAIAGADQRETPNIPYTGKIAGVGDTVPHFTQPHEAFEFLMNRDILQNIANWTNEKAQSFLPTPTTKVNGIIWRPVDVGILYIYFALVMLMGVIRLPKLAMYWSHGPLIGGPKIFCAKIMSRNKFFNIQKFLRFSSPGQANKKDPRTRIESFLSLLRGRCQLMVDPGEHIAVDESLILWKGRLLFKIFIRTKRSRFGIKVFFTCPGAERWQGYSWNFEVYYGTMSNLDVPGVPDNLSKSEVIVVKMMQGLLDAGRQVITDNWYTSIRLAYYLKARLTDITGIMLAKRGVPAQMVKEHLNKKMSTFMRKGDILICKYEDCKTVYSLTTRYLAETMEKTKRFFNVRTFFKLPMQLN